MNNKFEKLLHQPLISDNLDMLKIARQSLPDKPILQPWTSENVFDHIKQQIESFSQELDQLHDIGICLQLSGEWRNIFITDVVALSPNLILFKGFMEGDEQVRLVQHINQTNLLLKKVKRPDPQKPKRKIGFHVLINET